MSFCRWNDLTLELHTPERECRVLFPERSYRPPVLSYDGRYIAIGSEKKLYIHDFVEHRHFTLSKRYLSDFRFDKNNQLYYTDRNDIRVLNFETVQDTLLYHVGRTPHNPQHLGVSPNGHYVSFCRYVGDNKRLFVLDTKTKELKDYQLSVFHYAWLDDEHIVWSKGSGLEILDVNTGKNKHIIRNHKSLMKQGFDTMFEPFKQTERGLYVDLDFLRVLNGRIYFLLMVDSFEPRQTHRGLWSVGIEGNTPQFHYEFPGDCRKATYKYLADNGKLVWAADEWRVFDGTSEETCSNDWEWVIRFGERNA